MKLEKICKTCNKNPSPGEKNGVKTGRASSTAVKGVEGISCSKFDLLIKS